MNGSEAEFRKKGDVYGTSPEIKTGSSGDLSVVGFALIITGVLVAGEMGLSVGISVGGDVDSGEVVSVGIVSVGRTLFVS